MPMYDGGYLIIAVAFVFTLVAVFLLLWIENKISMKHQEKDRNDTYECGEKTIGDAKGPIHIQYYFVALMFTVFDVAVVLLIPWAFSAKYIFNAYLIAFTFIGIMLVGLLYAIEKGYMEWR